MRTPCTSDLIKQSSICLTLQGPDAEGHIRAFDSLNVEVFRFVVAKDSVYCVAPNEQQICAIHHRFLSGTHTLEMHGQKIKIKQSWEGMQYGKDIHTQSGVLKWRPANAGHEELHDANKNILARGKLPGLLSRKSATLRVFVRDEHILHIILGSWLVMLRD